MKSKTNKIKGIRILRAVSQILFFLILPGLYVSTFGGIKQIYLSVIHRTFSFSAMLPQFVEIIAIFPITILLGRFFCGWMCAFGSMGDLISALSHRLFKHRFRMPEKADRVLKTVKYGLLAFLIVAVWSLGAGAFKSSNPWDVFGLLFTPGRMPDIAYVATTLVPGLILLLAIIAASFFVDRFFCRYLCPLGAIFAIVSRLRIIGIKKPRAGCGKCRICTAACPMGIPLYKKDAWRSGECINCFACTEACPRKNVEVSISDGDVRPALAGAMAVAVMTGIYYAGSFESDVLANGVTGSTVAVAQSSTSSQSSASSSADASGESTGVSSGTGLSTASASSKYKDGTYQGEGTGFRGAATVVSVTIQNDKIINISRVSEGDTPDFFQRAYSTVVSEIIRKQSTDVTVVSGATFSSNGIMQAVADALSQAEI